MFYNRKYCGYTCIVVFEGQLKYNCNAEMEKQRIWKKYFHIWKTELLCPFVLKSRSAYIKCISVHFPLQMPSQSSAFTWMLCVYSLVLTCRLCFLTLMICDLLVSLLLNFCPEWISNMVYTLPEVKADLKERQRNLLIVVT